MLVNPILIEQDSFVKGILSVIGQGGDCENIETGIFISPSFNFGNQIFNDKDEYYSFKEETEDSYEYLDAYGVCDNIEQVKEKYSKWLNNPNLKFCIFFTKVVKSNQPAEKGWRWHKWGEYIGNLNPQHEYLYDEDDTIQEVYCFHIYRLLN